MDLSWYLGKSQSGGAQLVNEKNKRGRKRWHFTDQGRTRET